MWPFSLPYLRKSNGRVVLSDLRDSVEREMNDLTLYKSIAPRMDTWDLLTYRTEGIIPSLIHLWSPDNHAGAVLRLPEFEGLENRRWTLEAVGSGVKLSLLSHVLERVHGEVYWHQLKPEFNDLRNLAGCWGIAQSGVVKYDFKGLFAKAVGWAVPDMAKLLCSEYYYFGALKATMIKELETIPSPSELPDMGITLPPVLIVESEPLPPIPVVQP